MVATSVLLVASLALNAALVGAACAYVVSRGGLGFVRAKLAPTPVAPASDADMSAPWRSRVSQHDAAPVAEGDVVLLGDSITEWGDWGERLGVPRVRNRGIAGDTVAGVERRLGPILAGRPRVIALMIGVNDLLAGAEPQAVIAGQRALVRRIRAEAPETRLILQGVLPVDPHAFNARVLRRIATVNEGLAAIAREAGAEWLDLWAEMGGDAGLDRRYTYDGLHLNAEGYAAWEAALGPRLR